MHTKISIYAYNEPKLEGEVIGYKKNTSIKGFIPKISFRTARDEKPRIRTLGSFPWKVFSKGEKISVYYSAKSDTLIATGFWAWFDTWVFIIGGVFLMKRYWRDR